MIIPENRAKVKKKSRKPHQQTEIGYNEAADEIHIGNVDGHTHDRYMQYQFDSRGIKRGTGSKTYAKAFAEDAFKIRGAIPGKQIIG